MSSSPADMIVSLLSTSLGEDTARDIVRRELQAAGIKECKSREDAVVLLRRIEKHGGTAGLAARLAITRLERGVALLSDDKSTVLSASRGPEKSVSLEKIVGMLAPTLGDEQASATIAKSLASVRLRGTRFTRDETVAILDWIAKQGGSVGTVARFAKVRFLLEKEK